MGKRLIPRVFEEFLYINKKKKSNMRIAKSIFHKRKHRWQRNVKNVQHHSNDMNAN